MIRPSLEGGKEAIVVLVGDFEHREDFIMYIQLPDYDDFQCYDLGVGGV